MDDRLLAVYGSRADRVHAIGPVEDPPRQLRDAEVIPTGWVAMWCFRGHVEAARALLSRPR